MESPPSFQYSGMSVWWANHERSDSGSWKSIGNNQDPGKTLMLGKVEGRRRREQQRIRWLDGIISSVDMSLSKVRWIVKDREARQTAVNGVARLSHWTTTERIESWLVFEWGCVLNTPDAFHHSDLNLVTTRCVLQWRLRSKGICSN